jgi:hypothetical protein
MKKLILFCLLGLCFCINGKSQNATQVELKESGTLLDLLSVNEIERTERIVIKGNSLITNDFAVLKTMLVQYRLTEIDIENTSTNIITKKAFDGCSKLKKIKLPKFLVDIDYMAFAHCDNLEKIILPASVKKIDIGAFWYCSSLHSITLGRKIENIGGDCFHYSGLKEVHCKRTTPPNCEYGSFEGLHETCTLYVPKGCKKKYAFADGWLNFDNIQEENVEPAKNLQVNLQGGTFMWQLYPNYEGKGGFVVQWIYPKEDYFIEVENEETVVFHIAEENKYFSNWKIETILLNGNDITSNLTKDNLLYITIDKDSRLEVIMKDLNSTSNETIEKNSINISVSQNILHINNISPQEQINIYDTFGVLIYSKKGDSDHCEIPLPSQQIYFIQIGDKTFKIKN